MGVSSSRVDLLESQNHLYGRTITADFHTITRDYPAHFHEFYEIEVVKEGGGIQILNGKTLSLSPGTLYFLSPEDIHGVYPAPSLSVYNVMFTEDFLSNSFSFERLMACQGKQIQLSLAGQTRLFSLMQQLAYESDHRSNLYWQPYMQGLLDCIVIELLRHSEAVDILHTKGDIRNVLLYLPRHFREPITMDMIASYAHLSPGYFCKVFKKTTGQCFTDYLTALRVRYAERLLQSTAIAVTDVCYQSGFSSFSSFSRAFKKLQGITPSQFRHRILQNQPEKNPVTLPSDAAPLP